MNDRQARPGGRRRPPPARRSAGLLLVLTLVLACGGEPGESSDPTPAPAADPGATPPAGALTITPLAGPAPPAPSELAVFGVDQAWTSDAPGQSLLELPDGPVLQLGAGRPDQPLSLSRPWPALDQQPTRVRVRQRFGGQGRLEARVLRDGQVLARSEAVPLEAGAEALTDVELVLPAWEGPADTLVLDCRGAFRRLSVGRVALLRDPLLRAVDGCVRAGQAWRPGSVGVPGARWLLELDDPRPGRLVVHVGLPGTAPVGGRVTLVPAGGSGAMTARDAAPGWHELVLPVAGGGAFDLSVGGTAPCMVGTPRFRPDPPVPSATTTLVTLHAHRGDHLGLAFQGVDIDTPTLDGLAERGVLFTRARSSTDLTVGALAALQTGHSPRDTLLLSPGDRLAPAAVTLAERFASAGVTTLLVSGDRRLTPPGAGLHQGFDVVVGPLEEATWPAERVVAAARELLDLAGEQSVFLWLHLADGAWPHEPDPGLLARYHDPEDDPRFPGLRRPKVVAQTMPPAYRDLRDLAWARARYKARLSGADRALGELLAVPRVAAGVVAVTADHGLSLGEHGIWFKHLGLYPGALHVPLILAAGGAAGGSAGGGAGGDAASATGGDRGLPPGTRCSALAPTTDLGATLLSLAGLDRAGVPGTDLRGLVDGSRAPGPVFAVERHGLAAAASEGDILLVYNLRDRRLPHLVEKRLEGEAELYDLGRDWNGEQLLDDDRKAEGQALGFLLQDWLREARDLGWREAGPVDPAVLERLEALGYLGAQPVTAADPWAAARRDAR